MHFTIMVISLVGFALTHYGEFTKTVTKFTQNVWWYFYATMTIYYSVYYLTTMVDVYGFMKNLQTSPDSTYMKKHFFKISNMLLTAADLFIAIAELVFPYLVLFTNFPQEVMVFWL